MKKRICPLTLLMLAACASPASAQSYLTRLGGLGYIDGGGTAPASDARAISGSGAVVVGRSTNANGQPEAFVWTATTGMQGLGFLSTGPFSASEAWGISADGSVVVGQSTNADFTSEAFRWTAGAGISGLGFIGGGGSSPYSVAFQTSADGAVIVGYSSNVNDAQEAFRWTQATAMQGLGFINGGGSFPYSAAQGISGDGAVIVGYSSNANDAQEAFRWTQATGMQGLGFINGGGAGPNSGARAVSLDGSVIVGYSSNANDAQEAFRWTQATGMQGLGFINGGGSNPYSFARATSADGSVVVGNSSNANNSVEAFRWTATTGMLSIYDLLTTNAVQLGGWQLGRASAVSADGTLITGQGINTDGQAEAWLARIVLLPSDPVTPGVTPPVTPPVVPPAVGFISARQIQETIRDTAKIVLHSGAAIESALGDMRSVALEQCRADRPETERFCVFATGSAGFWSNNNDLLHGRGVNGSVGAAIRLLPGLQFGAAFSTGQNRYDLRLGGRNEVSAYGGSAFLSYEQSGYEGLQVLAAGTLMQADLDIARHYRNGISTLRHSHGSTKGYGAGVLGRVGWGVRVLDRAWLTPFAEVDWSLMRNKGYEESGGVFPFRFDSQRLSQTDLRLGTQVRYQMNDSVSLFGTVAWGHRLAGEGAALNGVMIDVYDISSGKLALWNNRAELSAGASWTIQSNARLTGSVATSFEGNSKPGAALRAGFSASF